VNDFDLVREMQVRLGKFAKGQTDFFPVMWPVSLSTENVHSLASEPYVVAPANHPDRDFCFTLILPVIFFWRT
jgi:hypothetical protein